MVEHPDGGLPVAPPAIDHRDAERGVFGLAPGAAGDTKGGGHAPITVLHVDTERGWRGGERQVLWLAQALDPMRYRSIIVARPDEPLAARAASARLPCILLDPIGEFDLAAAWRLHRAIGREQARIVHAHTAHAVALGAIATLGTDARLVVTRRVDFALRGNAATRWKYRRADAVIAISRAVADVLVASGVPRSQIEIIPSGVDLTRRTQPASRETLASLGVPASSPLVVQVAQLVPHKDPITFVEAIAVARRRLPDLHALLVGDGPLRALVVAAIDVLGLQDVVHVPGYRTDADALLAAADVVTLSSREEGLGTVLLDALAFGKAVAATRAGGIPEIIEHGTSGLLVPVGDGAALGEAIATLAADVSAGSPRRADIAAAARARARAFSVQETANRTAAVYEAAFGR